MSIVFFTGFPGFLGSELLPRVLARSPEHRAVCLIQSKFVDQARSRLEHIEQSHPHLRGRIDLTVGDITESDLGLEDYARIRDQTSEIFHLAAIYDLSVARDVAMRINVDGTRNVLDFAEGAPALRRLQYVSTCYVSGRHAGPFSEDDLYKGQSFNNYYEEAKYLAEIEVRARIRAGLPASATAGSRVVTSPSNCRPSTSLTSSSGTGQNVAAPRTAISASSPTIIAIAVARQPAVSHTQGSPWATRLE